MAKPRNKLRLQTKYLLGTLLVVGVAVFLGLIRLDQVLAKSERYAQAVTTSCGAEINDLYALFKDVHVHKNSILAELDGVYATNERLQATIQDERRRFTEVMKHFGIPLSLVPLLNEKGGVAQQVVEEHMLLHRIIRGDYPHGCVVYKDGNLGTPEAECALPHTYPDGTVGSVLITVKREKGYRDLLIWYQFPPEGTHAL